MSKAHLASVFVSLIGSLAMGCGSDDQTSIGAAGTGGTSSGGTGGTSSGGTSSGGTSSGGTSSGGTSSGGTSSGGTSGVGGVAGAAGTGGSGCTPVTLGDFQLLDTEAGGSSLAYALKGLNPSQDHVLYVEFFDGAGAQTSGSFDLSKPPDDNYSSCAHCLLAFEDVNGSAPVAFFQESGTLQVTTPDTAYDGKSAGSFQGIRLVQVTLQGSTTTKVAGGACLELAGSWDHTQ